MLLATQVVQIKGNRVYLAGTSTTHPEINNSKTKRYEVKVYSYYLEPTTDGKGVKITHLVSVSGTRSTM